MKRIVVLDRNRCRPGACDYVCMKSCPIINHKNTPRPAIKLREKSVFPVVNERICIACGICVSRCPWRALKSVQIPDETEEIPVHVYGESEFRLYRLPQLNKGRVVGLLGENGIGKTTLLNILSGNTIPNGGKFSDDAYEQFIAGITVPGMKGYFQDFNAAEISYKKQVLDPLRDTVNNVRDSLESCDEVGRLNEMAEFLQIKQLFDSSFTDLSGGELQRVSLAMTFLRDSQVYLVDEPATYLDVKQRLRLSRLFKEKAEVNRIIFVVEHDIAVLDYWSDIIHLLFGSPHVYGIVSRPLSVKNGINAFLLGQLKDENIIFRRKRIDFKKTVVERKWDKALSIKFKPLTKSLGERFTLEVREGGEIREGEVLVAMGENGLGKTTFARIISGAFDSSKTKKAIYERISYKPQHLSKDFDGTVEEFILEHSGRYVRTKEYKIQLLHPLGVWHLMDRPVQELSGGELQRTYIAACLAKDAELYIIDEGSAFLDARERLKITGVIRNAVKKEKRAVLAIEHDIQIAEALGDRVFLFNGTPSVYGFTAGPFNKRKGMNLFLASLDITFRRDSETGRARINKYNSKLDKYQRELGEYYYETA